LRALFFRMPTLFFFVVTSPLLTTAQSQVPPRFHRGLPTVAERNAAQWVDGRFHKCGTDYFSKGILRLPSEHHITVYQYHNFKWSLVPQPVTDADKLNGVDWRAELVVESSAVRSTTDIDDDGFSQSNPVSWLMWGDDHKHTFTQELKHQQWNIDDQELSGYGTEPITCDEVQNLLTNLKAP
jgi:hypothetical protein